MNVKYKLVQDITWNYRRLDPIASDDEMTQFYQSHNYDLLRKGGRPTKLRRLMEGGDEAAREKEWFGATLSTDEVIYAQSDFPMELFLLMGDNYIDNSVVDEQYDRKRIDFEVSIPTELRRRINRA